MEDPSATSLYVQACKLLLCGEDRSSWDQLVAILPQLRNALTCRVCRELIVDPVSSGYCQHYVCRACLKRKRALNPGCKWCLDFSKLRQSDEQIRVVLACYKLLCEAIKSSSYYANSDKNLAIDNLLKEAKLNSDMLPNSSFVVSNNHNINSTISDQNMAVNVVSRDQLKTCAREKVDVKTVVNDGGKVNFSTKKIHESTTNGILEPFDEKSVEHLKTSLASVEEQNSQSQTNTVKIETDNSNINCNNTNGAIIVEEKNDQQLSNEIKIETDDTTIDCSGPNSAIAVVEKDYQLQPDAIKIETDNINCNDHLNCNNEEMDSNTKDNPGEINNNGAKTLLIRKVKSKNKRACLRPRNGQLVQKFEAGRYMRKRKLVTPTHNQKNRPRKKCKISLTI